MHIDLDAGRDAFIAELELLLDVAPDLDLSHLTIPAFG